MSTSEFTGDRAEGLQGLEELAGEITGLLRENPPEKVRSETLRPFLGIVQERWQEATRASEWDSEQIRAFGDDMARLHDAFGAGVEMATGGVEPGNGKPEEERMPHESNGACVFGCWARGSDCVRGCRDLWADDPELAALCYALCVAAFDLCIINCTISYWW